MLPHYLIFGFSETRQSLTLFDHCLQLRLGLQVQPHGFQSVVRHLGRIPPGRESAQLLAGACHARAQSSEKLATLSRYYRYRATAISASAAVARIVPQVLLVVSLACSRLSSAICAGKGGPPAA